MRSNVLHIYVCAIAVLLGVESAMESANDEAIMQYFEDIELEQPIKGGSYELTESEIIEFAKKWDPLPFHIDKEAAEQTVYGGLIASGVHLSCVSCRCAHDQEEQQAVIAALGAESRNRNPGRPGDILTFETRAIEKRESESRPNAGIVVYQHCLKNQNQITVLETKVTLMVEKRNA